MRRRIFLLYLTLCFSLPALAEQRFQSLDGIERTVSDEVSRYLTAIYGAEKLETDIEFKVSNLDTRLQLADCQSSMEAEVKQTSYSAKSLSIKVQCHAQTRWTIYVPVSVDIYTQVAVSTRNLHRGETVSEGDYVFKRTNTSSISQSYLDTEEQLLGKELSRALRAGSVIKKQDLKEPTLVNKGETVVITAKHGALEVKSEATALSNGELGEQIKVQNPRSKRIVDARITGRGTAEILL